MTTTEPRTPEFTRTDATGTASAAAVRLWPSYAFADADAMIAWLTAIGFTELAIHRDTTGAVEHAEYLWPDGGGIMFGSVREAGVLPPPGGSSAYLISADPDAVFDRAIAAGGTEVRPMVDQDYGGRGGSVRDPEGNLWSFGDYQPGN